MLSGSDSYLTCSQASQILGVSRSTVQRYCDKGDLPLFRTAGGHRRIRVADVRAMASENAIAASMAVRKKVNLKSLTPKVLAAAILAGDWHIAKKLAEKVFLNRDSIVWLLDELMVPAMMIIAEDFDSGQIDHSKFCQAKINARLIVKQLSPIQTTNVAAPRAIGCTLEGDGSELDSMMMESFLGCLGYQAFHLGANVPTKTLTNLIEQYSPKYVWVSYSHLSDPAKSIQDNHELFENLPQDVQLLVAGRGIDLESRRQFYCHFQGDSFDQFYKVLNTNTEM